MYYDVPSSTDERRVNIRLRYFPRSCCDIAPGRGLHSDGLAIAESDDVQTPEQVLPNARVRVPFLDDSRLQPFGAQQG